MKDLYVDHELVDLNMSVSNVGTQKGCSEKKSFCLSSPCKNGGKLGSTVTITSTATVKSVA